MKKVLILSLILFSNILGLENNNQLGIWEFFNFLFHNNSDYYIVRVPKIENWNFLKKNESTISKEILDKIDEVYSEKYNLKNLNSDIIFIQENIKNIRNDSYLKTILSRIDSKYKLLKNHDSRKKEFEFIHNDIYKKVYVSEIFIKGLIKYTLFIGGSFYLIKYILNYYKNKNYKKNKNKNKKLMYE